MSFYESLTLSFSASGKIFLVGLVGYFVTRFGYLGKEGLNNLTRLMIDIIVPCAIGTAMLKSFSLEVFETAAVAALLPTLYIPISIAVSLLFFKVWKGNSPGADQAASALAAVPNSFYIPFPLAMALTPPEMQHVVTVYLGISMMAINPIQWTLGTFLVSGGNHRKENAPWYQQLVHALNPPSLSIIVGASLAMLFPSLASAANQEPEALFPLKILFGGTELIGQAMAPLAMIILGALIAQCEVRSALTIRRLIPICFIRYLIVPGIVYTLWQAGELPGSQYVIFVILLTAAAPPATNLGLVARRYDGEWEVVSGLLLVSNAISMLILPFWMALALHN